MATEVRHHRYAVYFAPAVDGPWWEMGSAWLGRCAAHGLSRSQPMIPGLSAQDFAACTAAPRRYGWHATLKAPFALAPGVDEVQLRMALSVLASSMRAFTMPTLQVTRLDDFLALTAVEDENRIAPVAAACVTDVQPFAAALSPATLARRRKQGLSPEQDALLLRWGYPYVLQCFRFHLSLTGSLAGMETAQVDALVAAAQAHFGVLPACRFEHLTLFAEPAPDTDFVLLEQLALRP